MKLKKMITLMASSVFLIGASHAAEEKGAHHDLAWLGYLNLPKAKIVPSNLLTLKKPLELKSWKIEEEATLSWLPPAKYERRGLVAEYHIKLNGSTEKENLNRRQRSKHQ